MQRKYYCFGSKEDIQKHLADIKTAKDIAQLAYDIRMSETNLVKLTQPMRGIWLLDAYLEIREEDRHIIMTEEGRSRLEFTKEEQERFASFIVITE